MLQIFYKRDGAISVFLSLILLPVMLFGGIATDAARVYMSKIIISDAGETALNAGLTQYDEELHDEYGLFVMKKTPASMSGDLERFFNEEDYIRLKDYYILNKEKLEKAKEELEKRLQSRIDKPSPAEIRLRLSRFDYEESKINLYDYVIKNDNLEKTVQIVMTILKNEIE